MKTVLNVLDSDISFDIARAHEALVRLEPFFAYARLPVGRKNDRHGILDAISQLAIEIEAKAADVEVDEDRRVLLGVSLLVVKDAIQQNAWGTLVGDDKEQGAEIVAIVEQFEAARREITVHCHDLEMLSES